MLLISIDGEVKHRITGNERPVLLNGLPTKNQTDKVSVERLMTPSVLRWELLYTISVNTIYNCSSEVDADGWETWSATVWFTLPVGKVSACVSEQVYEIQSGLCAEFYGLCASVQYVSGCTTKIKEISVIVSDWVCHLECTAQHFFCFFIKGASWALFVEICSMWWMSLIIYSCRV